MIFGPDLPGCVVVAVIVMVSCGLWRLGANTVPMDPTCIDFLVCIVYYTKLPESLGADHCFGQLKPL